MNPLRKTLRCFISNPPYVNPSFLKDVLRSLNVEIYDEYDFSTNSVLTDSVTDRIRQADLAIIIISDRDFQGYYHLGLSDGLNKPALVLVEKSVDPSTFIQSHPHLVTDMKQTTILTATINKFISDVSSGRHKANKRSQRNIPSSSRPSNPELYLHLIREMRQSGNGLEVQNLVYSLFQDIGLEAVNSEPNSANRKGADIAVWSDQLSNIIGNPLLIEIKVGNLSLQRITETEQLLMSYLHQSESRGCLLLYLDRKGKRFQDEYLRNPLIFRYDLEDFVQAILEKSFEQVILERRNRIVHGSI